MWVNLIEKNGFNTIDDDLNGYIDDVNGWDTAGNTGAAPDNDPCDTIGHGTHVAGIIGAVGNNAIGIAGVNWNVSIMAIKVFPDNQIATSDDFLIEGIIYAIVNGAVSY